MYRICATDLVSVVYIAAIRPYVTLAHFTTLIDTLRGQQDAPRTRMDDGA